MSHETIPLNKLSVWKGNVRKTGAEVGLDELKASILVHGLLNPLTVQKTDKGDRRVIAGQRRLLALRALQKEGAVPADHPVQCNIVSSDSNATEISLAENVVRTQMHPADQFEAFRDLIDKGASVADVAARFGVTDALVTKRLKLGRVSPKMLDLYRKGAMTLEQVQALTLTDDHVAQEAAWEGAQGWQKQPHGLREMLTKGEVSSTDKRIKFIGSLDVYEAAGGKVRRDLFDDRNAGYVSDLTLLNRLVVRKLEETADEVRSEGWKWVETSAEFDWDAMKGFGRVHEGRVALTPEQEARLSELGEQYDELAAASEEEDLDDEQAAKLEQTETEMEALQSTQKIYNSDDITRAGCFVSIGYQGEAEIRRGYVKPEDMPEVEAKTTANGQPAPVEESETDGLSAALVEDLTAQRTAALRVELAKSPLVALAATVHALGLSHFYVGSYRVTSCVKVSTSITPLAGLIKNREQSKALQAFNAESSWTAKVPEEAEDFWQWCVEQPMAILLELLACLVGRSVDVVTTKVSKPGVHADQLAAALDLDMTKWFTPTAENYFSRVSKPTIIKALVEMDGGTPVAPVTEKLKKGALAEFAEKAVADSGWLPEILRSEPATETEEEPALDDAA